MQRVSVFIDGANFLYGIRSINNAYTDFKFDFGKFVKDITKGRILANVYYYNASLKYDENPELFKKQQKFFSRLKNEDKFNVILCKRQRWRNEDGSSYCKIKGDDIHLAIDMLKEAYENKYDTAILISGDGDFKPVVDYVKAQGRKVENYYFKDNISMDLLNACNASFLIDKKIVNKFFYREEQLTLGDTLDAKRLYDSVNNQKQ